MRPRQRNKCVYTGRVGARMRPPRRPKPAKPRLERWKLTGGPLAGRVVRLEAGTGGITLPICMTVGAVPYAGRYEYGIWKDSNG